MKPRRGWQQTREPRYRRLRPILFALILILLSPSMAAAQQAGVGWPRTIASDGETIQVYQPQVDKWEKGKLEAREAIVISQNDLNQAIYGVVWLTARTTLDQDKREVTLYDVEVTKASFPSASADQSRYVEEAKKSLRNWSFSIALDRLLADMAITQTEEGTQGDTLNSTPPKIFIRENPALLVLIDGDPVLKKVNDTGLMRVINSPAVILLDPATGNYYLQGDSYWMVAPKLNGPWAETQNPPQSVTTEVAEEEEPGASNAAKPPTVSNAAPPEIIVSTEPAELIQLNGEPQFSPIANTKLLYVTNTDSDVFMSMPDQHYYVLLSGRWFSALKLDGPWQFLPGSKLPPDFALIPPGHAKGDVLASVPGTPQAQDAVAAAQVPQTATVDRSKATFDATYDGDPQFKAIEGTDMAYASNSPNDIVRVHDKYYAVSDGVWFVADDPMGPWAVCDSVPPDIYSLPPTAPVYQVKYVYVYDSTPDYVYVGYLPGYFGAYIWDGVVVYGTGYWYPCWDLDFWYGWPWTWGFGWQYAYWGWGFRWTPVYGYPWYWRPWRRPGWGYGPWNQRVLYNRSLERSAGRISLPNRTVYDRWKASAVVSQHPVSLRSPAGGLRPQTLPLRPALGKSDIYAGQDGNVYEHRSDGWYRRNGPTWERVTPAPIQPPGRPTLPQTRPMIRPSMPSRPAPPRPHVSVQELNRQRNARIQGQNRVNQFRNMQPPVAARPSMPARPGGRPHP
jgi:hypothetical protein